MATTTLSGNLNVPSETVDDEIPAFFQDATFHAANPSSENASSCCPRTTEHKKVVILILSLTDC